MSAEPWSEAMIGIFTGARIKELDRYTIEHEPVSSIDLVERAAATWVYEFERLYTQQRRIIVFAGPGNNGADALCAARILGENGYSVDAFLFNVSGSLSPECNECRVRLLETSGIRLTEVVDNFIPPELSSQTVVVDGLFGVGLNRPLQGGFAKVVEFLNQSGAEIVSIDIPSGLFEEDNFGNNPNAIIRATHTLTFEYPKLSFLFSENADYVGKWKVLNIGLSVEGKQTIKTEYFLNTDFDISGIIRQRPRFAHKGTFGHALLIAGSRGKMGAACLAAKACLRSGIGLLTTHIPACGEAVMQTAVPEAMVHADEKTDIVCDYSSPLVFQAVGIGPGIGRAEGTVLLVEKILSAPNGPLVLDADALNIIAENRSWLDRLPINSILTPHSRELERLTTHCNTDYERLRQARFLACHHHVYVVLKGAFSATCMPGGMVVFNNTGNPGMATGGSGDVLMGIITGLLGSGYLPASACVLGNYIHGLAGDIYAGRYSQESLIASDIIDNLGTAFRQVRD